MFALVPAFEEGFSRGIVHEIGHFFVLLSFAFVLRALFRLQGISKVNPNTVTIVVGILSVLNFVIGVNFPADPVVRGWLVYWYHSSIGAGAFAVLLLIFTFAMATTFLFNIRKVKERKETLLFLGLFFLLGGAGGELLVLFNEFTILSLAYLSLFFAFMCVILFVLALLRKEKSVLVNSDNLPRKQFE